VDSLSGYAAHDGFPSRTDYFIDGTQPRVDDPIHLRLKVCRGSNGLAPPEDVSRGDFDEKEFIKLVESDPISKDGKNRWQEGIDNWILQQADKDKYYPPSNYCRTDGMVNVDFESPSNQSTVGNEVVVKVKTDSLIKVVEIKLWVDNKEEKIWKERPYEVTLNLANGPHTLKVKATDKDGNTNEEEIRIGVNVAWDWKPTPTATNTPIPSPTIILVPSLIPTSIGVTL